MVVSSEFDEPTRFATAFSHCYRALSFGFAPRSVRSHSPLPPAWPKIRGLYEYVSNATNAGGYDCSGSFWPTFKFSPSVDHGRSRLVMNNDQKNFQTRYFCRLWNTALGTQHAGSRNVAKKHFYIFPNFFSAFWLKLYFQRLVSIFLTT